MRHTHINQTGQEIAGVSHSVWRYPIPVQSVPFRSFPFRSAQFLSELSRPRPFGSILFPSLPFRSKHDSQTL